MIKDKLKRTPLEVLPLSGLLRFAILALFGLIRLLGLWRYPIKTDDDVETMGLTEKIYWLYKTEHPLVRAERGSCLESFFKSNNASTGMWLPPRFRKRRYITFSAVGDLVQNDLLDNSKNGLYVDVADVVFDKDISLANLECPLTENCAEMRGGFESMNGFSRGKDAPLLHLSRKQFDAVKGHGAKKYTVMHTACNHSLDFGLDGLEASLDALEGEKIASLGTNRNESGHRRGIVLEKNSVRIGLIGATFSLNGKKMPRNKGYCVNVVRLNQTDGPVDCSLLKEQIAYCKSKKCDFIIASLHWGVEFEFFPRMKQVETAHSIVELGADLIVSHHPHVIQPVEYYRTKRDPGRMAVIYYSLGNLTSPFSAPYFALSAIANCSIVKGVLDGEPKTYIEDARTIPVLQQEYVAEGVHKIELRKLRELIARNTGEGRESPVPEAVRYADMVLGEGWRA